MKKVFLFAALTAGLVLTSCSSDDLTEKEQPQVNTAPGAVGFEIYTQKTTTRSGVTGSLTTAKLIDEANNDPFNTAGFGVFGFYTDNNEYEQRSVPNFMYNQQVNYKSGAWTYEPVVYWPNEYGDKAISDDADKVTFFAYAPYVKVVPSSGKIDGAAADKTLEQWGITGMTKNTAQGDPVLKYIGSFDADKSVDLCWGVADNGDGAVWNTTQTGNPQTEIKNGLPWIDLERPAGVNQKVRFTFKHATAQMRVTIDADVDVDGRGHTNGVAPKTRVWVRQVTFKGFTMKGSLNLNNDEASTPKWLDYNGQNELVAEDVVVYDGRKDGKEGVMGAVATNEKTLGLNTKIIQTEPYAGASWSDGDASTAGNTIYNALTLGGQPGVTNSAVTLFENGGLFYVIPGNDNFEVEIVYDVETVDQNLAQNLSDGATKGSTIENRISKTISFGSEEKLHSGHSYTLALHLGMNSVKFDASVTDWIEEAAQDVDLPLNTPVFAAAKPVNGHGVTLPYSGNYTFAITGLDGGETVKTDATTPTAIEVTTGAPTWSASERNANTSGVAIQELTTAVNPTTKDRSQTITWTGQQSSKGVQMTFKQKAHPLFLAIKSLTNNASKKGEITLMRRNNAEEALDATSTSDWSDTKGWLTKSSADVDAVLKVWRNGTLLTGVTFSDDAGGTDNRINTITIDDKLQPGDVIMVELTTGDAPTETVTARYDGMYFVTPSESIQYGQTGYTVPTVKNANGAITYISSDTDVATVDGSGAITTEAPGKTTITATDAAGNEATFKLTVTKQDTEITSFSDDTSSATETSSGTTVYTFSPAINGKLDATTVTGSITYELVSAMTGSYDVTSAFTIVGNVLKTASSVSGSNYKIKVKAKGTVTNSKYENPEDITVTITYK